MLTRELFDLAITLADRFEVMTKSGARISEPHLHGYWAHSRSLTNLWSADLRRCTLQLEEIDYAGEHGWLHWVPLLEEILVAEMLTRIWTALLECHDARRNIQENGPIARSVLRGQLDARQRVLRLLVRGRQQGVLVTWGLNRLRQQLERWTDLVLSMAADENIAPDLFHDHHRLRFLIAPAWQNTVQPAAVLRAAASSVLQDTASIPASRVAYHRQICSAILGAWSPQLFHDSGSMLSAWHVRLLELTDDSQGLLADWLREPAAAANWPEHHPENPGVSKRFR